MTDLEKFIDLYKSLGIELEAKPSEDCSPEYIDEEEDVFCLELGYTFNNRDKKVDDRLLNGYGGFYSTIHFDANGKFIKQSFWE